MKILLDECVTYKLKRYLLGLEVHTVTEVGLSGTKNGKLLAAAEQMEYDVLLTIDKNMDYQQNIRKFNLTLVVFDVVKSNIKYLAPLIPEFLAQSADYQPGNSYLVSLST